MKKNVAGQAIGAQMVSASDGSAFTGAVTVYVTGDAGTQAVGSVGSGACTHEGNGYHTYAPAQAETNYDLIAFTFIGTGAIPATVQCYTNFPQTGDNFARLGAPAGASVSADIAALQADTDNMQTRLPASLINGRMSSDVGSIATDTTSPTNLANQFNGTGVTGGTYPATQAQLANIVAVGAATNVQAESYVLTIGTQSSGTYANTAALDGVYHQHTDTAGAMDLYYQFDIGPESSPVSVTNVGYLLGGNDTLGIYAYNWVALTWDQIGSRVGSGVTTNTTSTLALYAAVHVGSGVNLGKVRIRFYAASGLTTATLSLDQLFVSFAINRQTVGYANGSFWINTVSGTAGLVPYFNYTADNPGNSLTGAQTLSATVPLTVYTASNNSSFTLSAAFENSILNGSGYALALGGQSISGSQIIGASISGIATGVSNVIFARCIINNATLPICDISDSKVEGTITLGMAGEYHLHNSHCGNINGVAIDFGVAVGNNQILVHGWQGDVEFRNMGQLGTDIVHLAGDGEFTINANCIGGEIHYQGNWKIIDNSGGAVMVMADDITSDLNLIQAAVLTNGVVLTAAERNATADALLNRDMSLGTDSGSSILRTPRQALRALRNKTFIAGSALTVTKEDDTTASWTATVTTSPSDPISSVDPN